MRPVRYHHLPVLKWRMRGLFLHST